MITLVNKTDFYEYYGLSTDNKPMNCPNGSQFIEIDTGKIYLFDGNNIAWHEGIGGGGGGTSDYTDLQNKPQINGITLSGNKSTSDLDILPTASWTATVTASFAAQSTMAEVGGTSFTKVSDKVFTAEQLDGAILSMQGTSVPITSSMLTDMSSMGVTGTLIDLTSVGFGPVVFSCTEAGNVVSEPGFYFATDYISYAPLVTISYTESLTAQTRAIGIGDMEMEDGVTDLPTGVVWLQYES